MTSARSSNHPHGHLKHCQRRDDGALCAHGQIAANVAAQAMTMTPKIPGKTLYQDVRYASDRAARAETQGNLIRSLATIPIAPHYGPAVSSLGAC